jgi:hypothetical protein
MSDVLIDIPASLPFKKYHQSDREQIKNIRLEHGATRCGTRSTKRGAFRAVTS